MKNFETPGHTPEKKEDKEMSRQKVNLNESVRFKITKAGEKVWREFHNLKQDEDISRDKDGFTELPLWEVMRIFGPAMKLGGGENNPLEGNLEIEHFEIGEEEKEKGPQGS